MFQFLDSCAKYTFDFLCNYFNNLFNDFNNFNCYKKIVSNNFSYSIIRTCNYLKFKIKKSVNQYFKTFRVLIMKCLKM